MNQRNRRGRKCIIRGLTCASIGAGSALCPAQVTVTKNSSTNWTITNGQLTAVFNPNSGFGKLTSLKFGASPTNLISSLDSELAGTPFVANTANQTLNSVMGPNNSWADVWTDVPSGGTNNNPLDFQFHYVFYNNDPAVHVYEVVNHSATDPATSIGQGQFLFRGVTSEIQNLYQVNTGPNNMVGVTIAPVPSTTVAFNTAKGQAAHIVQDATTDLTGTGVAGDNGTTFFTKYDYSIYSQFMQAETAYGNNFAATQVYTSRDTMTGGPTKQMLAWTDNAILNMEFMSNHYSIDRQSNAFPGAAYQAPAGVAGSRLFGPFTFKISSMIASTAAGINQGAIDSIPTYQSMYDSETQLLASGYVPTASRGSVQVIATNPIGWNPNSVYNTVVLSDNTVNMQETHQGYQYWAQMGQNGAATMDRVVPGTYRMTLYQTGQWGETRIDGVQVQSGKVTVPQNVNFTPENFGSSASIWTIGTLDRSSHEFLNGHNAQGLDQRQFSGAYDFWGEQQISPGNTLRNVVYYGTQVGATPASNDPNKWIGIQWYTFNPKQFNASTNTTDNYQFTAPVDVRDNAHGGSGPGPGSYHGAPWEVHFTVSQDQLDQGQYAVISVSAAALQSDLFLSLNGHTEEWVYNAFAGANTPMLRSGDAAFVQWAAFEFPIADLNAAGIEDLLTLRVDAGTNSSGIMYDALRMEITNTSADPSVTGWHDYTYINGSTEILQDDAIGQIAQFAIVPEPSGLVLLLGAVVPLLGGRRQRQQWH